MSLKSFDKFCETLITAAPGSQQEIFDERQKQMQIHIVVQAMTGFILLTFVHCFIYDYLYKWSESIVFPLILFTMVAVIFYVIKAGVKGCYIGINGSFSRYTPAIMCLIFGFLNGFNCFMEIDEGIIKRGALSNSFVGVCAFSLMFVSGILTIFFINKSNKEDKK